MTEISENYDIPWVSRIFHVVLIIFGLLFILIFFVCFTLVLDASSHGILFSQTHRGFRLEITLYNPNTVTFCRA